MKFRKYMSFIVSGCIALLLLIITLVFLVRWQKKYTDVKNSLNSKETELRSLNGRNPFPSKENLQIERDNVVKLRSQLADLREWMKKGQIKMVEATNPTEFQVQLNPRLKKLLIKAKAVNTELDSNFKFGFPKYAQGEMPAPKDVPRLSRQAQMIESICNIMFDERIDALTAITRQKFDVRENASSTTTYDGYGNAFDDNKPKKPSEDESKEEQRDDYGMYAWETFTVEFRAKESALWSTLRSFANTNLLISVESLSFETLEDNPAATQSWGSDKKSKVHGFGSGDSRTRGANFGLPTPVAEPEVVAREKRVVAGGGVLNVTMKLNFYRFLDEKTEEETQK